MRTITDDRLREMLANIDHTTDAPWKDEGYIVMGDWHASGAIARVTGSQHAFADTRHIANFDPPTSRQILTELLALRNPPSGEAGEPVAWQWSDFSGKWYTVDTARLALGEQEELARAAATSHEGRVRPLYALPTIKEPSDGK